MTKDKTASHNHSQTVWQYSQSGAYHELASQLSKPLKLEFQRNHCVHLGQDGYYQGAALWHILSQAASWEEPGEHHYSLPVGLTY